MVTLDTVMNRDSLVDIRTVIPTIILDIRYATTHNFTGKKVYSNSTCYLISAVAQALKQAVEQFSCEGYSVKIWDGYRPLRVQHIFWALVPDERYVANPEKGSRHNRGCSVDLTLVDSNGVELDMGTDFDDFTEKAHRDFVDFSEQVLKNRHLLQTVMENNGFIGWKEEWWHFDFVDWQKHPLLDIILD